MALHSLSSEVLLNHIFPFLDTTDLIVLMHSCSRLSNLLREANKLWKAIFKEDGQKFAFMNKKIVESIGWKRWFRFKKAVQVKEIVKSMSQKYYPESPDIDTPEDVMHTLTTGDYPHLEFVDDELRTQLKFWPVEVLVDDWTLTYYANHLYTEVKMFVLEKKWSDYMAKPETQKSLFEGALLMSQWINMDYQESPNLSETESTLDWIVERA